MCVYITKLLLLLRTHIRMYTYQQMVLDIHSSIGASEVIPADITDLVGYIWNEANGELNNVLSVPVEGIRLEQVEKAEAALLSITLILDGTSKDGDDVHKLTNEFYAAIPHKQKLHWITREPLLRNKISGRYVYTLVNIYKLLSS